MAFYLLLSMAALTSLISPTRSEYSLLPRGVTHQPPTCCNDCYGWMYAYWCSLLAVIGRVEFPQGGRCRPLRCLRLCDRTNLPTYRRTSHLPIHRLVCTKEIGEGRVYQLGNHTWYLLWCLLLPHPFCLSIGYSRNLPTSVRCVLSH